MNRLLALAAWIFLSTYLMGPAPAAAGPAPVDLQQVQQTGTTDQVTLTTPAAALTWNEHEKARSENKKRAETMREKQINREQASQAPPKKKVQSMVK